jgi:hypothetical protein
MAKYKIGDMVEWRLPDLKSLIFTSEVLASGIIDGNQSYIVEYMEGWEITSNTYRLSEIEIEEKYYGRLGWHIDERDIIDLALPEISNDDRGGLKFL